MTPISCPFPHLLRANGTRVLVRLDCPEKHPEGYCGQGNSDNCVHPPISRDPQLSGLAAIKIKVQYAHAEESLEGSVSQ